jgi:hypothetical protein
MAEGLGGFARDMAVGVPSGGITQSMGASRRHGDRLVPIAIGAGAAIGGALVEA